MASGQVHASNAFVGSKKQQNWKYLTKKCKNLYAKNIVLQFQRLLRLVYVKTVPYLCDFYRPTTFNVLNHK